MDTGAAVGQAGPAGPADWWRGLATGRLLLNRCCDCGATWVPWMAHCPDCGRRSIVEAIEASGSGTVYSWVVVSRSVSTPEDVPFTVLSVRLDEGAMVYGRLARSAPQTPHADMPVTAVFAQRADETQLEFEPERPEPDPGT